MALPPAIVRRTVTYGPETDYQGNAVTGTITFTPLQTLTWRDTGQGLHIAPIKVDLDITGAGAVSLVCTDQPGLYNAAGEQVTNWAYSVRLELRTSDGSNPITSPPARLFQVPSGSGALDLDNMVPVTSSTGVVVLVPAITNLAGLSGPTVTLEDLNALGLGGGGGGSYTAEQAQDAAALLLTSGVHTGGITFTYDDAGNRINVGVPALPTLAPVATSGAYGDLSGKPTIPAPTTDASLLTTGTLNAARLPAHTHTSANISDFAEAVQDAVGALLGAGSNVILNYDDAANSLTISATAAGGTGLDAEQVRDAIGVALIGVGNVSVVVNDAADTITITTTATVNATDASLRDRSTHTGTQPASTVTGLAVVATSGAYADLSGKPTIPAAGEPVITPGTTAQYWRGDKTWQTLPTPGSGSLPAGGTTGQALTKTSNTDGAVGWSNVSSGSSVVPSSSTPMETAYSRFATRDVAPVPIVVLGSSTAGGQGSTNDNRNMMNRWVIYTQDDFPLSTKAAQPTFSNLSASMTLSNGIQHIKAAAAGATAASYLDATKVSQIGAINPAVLAHQIGSNDYANGVAVATYKANVAGWLDQLDAAITVPHMHVLIHGHRRTNVSNPAAPWSSYGTALQELATARSSNVVFLDLSTAFRAALQDTTDPLGFRDADNIHLNDKGHAFGADLLRAYFRIAAPVPAPWVPLPDPTVQALSNTAAPAISGSPTTGNTLTVSNGSWSATPDSYTYAWKRAGSIISGATAATYVLVSADEGQAITCTVTAIKSGYSSASATSASVTASSGSSGTLTNTTAPAVTGTGTVGQVLTTTNGAWSATPDSYTYQWRRDGAAISGATSQTYTLVSADGGTAITCAVTAVKATYTSGTAVSNSTAVALQTFTNSTVPTISGTTTTGNTVTSSTGTWSVSPDAYAYQWKRAGTAISGATSSAYTLVSADEGQAITVTVTATKANYSPASATSTAITPTAGTGPSDLTTGMLWDFDGDTLTAQGNGVKASSWTSQGGSLGALAVSQATAGNQPTVVTSAVGGHTALRFLSSASTRLLSSGTTAPVVTGTSASYVYVIKRTGASTRLIGGINSANYHTLFDSAAVNGISFGIEALSGSVLTYTTSILDRWIIIIVSAAGASSKMVIGNEATITGTLNTSNGVGVAIGGSGSGSGYGTFDLTKYRAYDHALTDTEITQLKTFLNSRYALT